MKYLLILLFLFSINLNFKAEDIKENPELTDEEIQAIIEDLQKRDEKNWKHREKQKKLEKEKYGYWKGLWCEEVDYTNYKGYSKRFALEFYDNNYTVEDRWYYLENDKIKIDSGKQTYKLHAQYIEILNSKDKCLNVINRKTLKVIRTCSTRLISTPKYDTFWTKNEITSSCELIESRDWLRVIFKGYRLTLQNHYNKKLEGNKI
jgi:hypothetical protein